MAKFADQWEPNGPFGIVTDSNMSGGYRVVTNDADKSDITILPPERQKVGMLVYVTATGKTWRLTTLGVRSPGTETYTTAPVFADVSGGGIGGAIGGSEPASVLYIDSSGLLAQDPDNFRYTDSAKLLTVGSLTFDGGPTGNIYRTSYGSLSIGNDGNTGSILIGTTGNDDSVVIGRDSGPVTYVESALGVKGVLTMSGPDNKIYVHEINSPTGYSTLALGGEANTFLVELGRTGGSVSVPGFMSVTGTLNANGGVGISSGTSLNIGNDDTITTAINVGTTLTTGANINIGKTSGGAVVIEGNSIGLGKHSSVVDIATAAVSTVTIGVAGTGTSTVNVIGSVVVKNKKENVLPFGTKTTSGLFLGGAYRENTSGDDTWGGGTLFSGNYFAGSYHLRLMIPYGKTGADGGIDVTIEVGAGTLTFGGLVSTNAVGAPPTPTVTSTTGVAKASAVSSFSYSGGFVRTGAGAADNYFLLDGVITLTSDTGVLINVSTDVTMKLYPGAYLYLVGTNSPV